MGGELIPSWWQFALLALAAFRITRLVGWDDFPLAVRTRNLLAGLRTAPTLHYRRPGVAHFLSCPFCQGFWVSVLVVYAWWLWPHAVLIACVPFAAASVVGLIAKNLDA